jgi:hypothetical protein
MDVDEHVDIEDGYSIEWGTSSWSDHSLSVRNRYETSTGGFSPHSSSELPIGDLEHLIVESAKRDHIDPDTAARMIEALAASISRQAEEAALPDSTSMSPKFEPWVGEKYATKGFKGGVRLLVLGESHYGIPGDDDASFTQQVVKDHGKENRHAFFTKTAKLVLGMGTGEYLHDEDRRQFWDSVAFYNYVQEYAGERPDGNVTSEMWEKAKEPFLEVVEQLEPDALLVLGKQLGDHLPDLGEFDFETCVVTHPSSSRFSYSDWTSDVQEMIEAV